MEKNIIKRINRVVFLSLFNLLFSRITRFWYIKRILLRLANVKVGKNTKVVGPLILGNAVQLEIGDYVWLGQDFKVYGSGKCIIGDRCDIGPDVTILSGSHEIGNKERRAGLGCHFTINIGCGVWVGGRTTLFNNIYVGDSSIIATSATVNKSVPSNTIVAGVPAKVIKEMLDT